MEGPLDNKAREILGKSITNIEMISYFRRSKKKTPIFLSDINKKYVEIKALIYEGLVNDIAAVKSYIFYLDKFENYFYSLYQQKIDKMKDDIWRRKRKKTDIIRLTEEMEPDQSCEDYDLQLQKVLEFAQNSIKDLDDMELEKEDMIAIYSSPDHYSDFPFYLRRRVTVVANDRGTLDRESRGPDHAGEEREWFFDPDVFVDIFNQGTRRVFCLMDEDRFPDLQQLGIRHVSVVKKEYGKLLISNHDSSNSGGF